MARNFFQKSLSLLMQRQTNILSAAFVIMGTVVLSQILGLIRQRLLVSTFGVSDSLGVYLAANRLPDALFQIIIAGALSSAFIPVFSDFLSKNREEDAHRMASTLLALGSVIFFFFAVILFLFAPFFLQLLNLGSGFSGDIILMTNLVRVIIFAQILFIVGTFFAALLQSYNHFFIPGFAAAMYNLGIIIGILFLPVSFGIFAPAIGSILGAVLFILFQLPMVRKLGFQFTPSFDLLTPGVLEVVRIMWPRTLSLLVFQGGTLATIVLVSFISDSSRSYVILDTAQTLAFAPVGLIGLAVAQAVFPVLARMRENIEEFKVTFIASFTQVLYLVLPISALLLVLRIPIVRLVFGAGRFTWNDTVDTGYTLAFFSFGIFAQALIYLVLRGFYALHDTKTPLIVGSLTTLLMVVFGAFFVLVSKIGVEGIAIAYSLSGIVQVSILFIFLDRKVGGFEKRSLFVPVVKILLATIFTGFAIYIPIKLLDQLVFDTTRTINLLFLTGISTICGLVFYLFLTWFFNVKEAIAFVLLFKKVGSWREILGKSDEVINSSQFNP